MTAVEDRRMPDRAERLSAVTLRRLVVGGCLLFWFGAAYFLFG